MSFKELCFSPFPHFLKVFINAIISRVLYWHQAPLQLVLALTLVAPFECLVSSTVYLAINLLNVSFKSF